MKLSGIGSDEAGLAGEDSDPPNGSVSASKSIPPWKDPPEAAQASHKAASNPLTFEPMGIETRSSSFATSCTVI